MSRRTQAQEPKDPRQVGGVYRCGYWSKEYTVNSIDRSGPLAWIEVTWEDGRVGRHCTEWDPRRDTVVRQPTP